MREVLEVIWGVLEANYFCKRDSTGIGLTGKSAERLDQLPVPEALRDGRCDRWS